MPKLRNGATDAEKLSDWIGRKIVNHNPLNEVDKTSTERQSIPRLYSHGSKGYVGTVKGSATTVIAKSKAGRIFKVETVELTEQEAEAYKDRLAPLGA